jgi:hypothetical protein
MANIPGGPKPLSPGSGKRFVKAGALFGLAKQLQQKSQKIAKVRAESLLRLDDSQSMATQANKAASDKAGHNEAARNIQLAHEEGQHAPTKEGKKGGTIKSDGLRMDDLDGADSMKSNAAAQSIDLKKEKKEAAAKRKSAKKRDGLEARESGSGQVNQNERVNLPKIDDIGFALKAFEEFTVYETAVSKTMDHLNASGVVSPEFASSNPLDSLSMGTLDILNNDPELTDLALEERELERIDQIKQRLTDAAASAG